MTPVQFTELKEALIAKFVGEYHSERIGADANSDATAEVQVAVENMQL